MAEQNVWRKYDDMERRLSAPLTQRMLDLAGLAPGMLVLDIASGRGEPAIPAAHRVAPGGSVLGVDVSDAVLQMARERAAAEGVSNLELRVQSAESLNGVPAAHFDAALSRWALMYFSSPLSALQAVARALRPGCLFVAALWAEPERVSYFSVPRAVLAKYTALPEIDFEVPGIFRYAHLDRIHRDFSAAGLSVEHVEELDTPVLEAQSDEMLIDWVRVFGLERFVRDLPPAVQTAWERDLVKETGALSGDGALRLGGTTRIVVARTQRPATAAPRYS